MAIVRNASILFVCTMIGNFSNYCFQFLMGRSLGIEDYGTMNALLSVTTSITLPTTAIMFVVAKYASTYVARGESARVGSLYRGALVRVTIAAVVISGAFLALSGVVADYLKVADLTMVFILAIGIFGSFIMTVNLGMHQGLQRFYYLGAGLGLGGVLRLALGAAFLVLGFRINGAILATVLPSVLIFVITFVPLSSYLGAGGTGMTHERVLRYGIPVVIASSAFALLSNLDLIMVKHYLSPTDAGLYSSVAVLGKTMLYLPSAFALAVFPMVSESTALKGDSFKILDRALLCTAIICSAGLLVFMAAPETIMGLLFGAKFHAAAVYLKYYGAAMSFMSILSILISFNLARGKTGFIYTLIAACALLVGLIAWMHAGLQQVMLLVLGLFFVLTAFNVLLVLVERRSYYRLKGYEVFDAPEAGAEPDYQQAD